MHDGCAPTAEMFIREMKPCHIGMLLENRMNHLTQLPYAFAVYDSHAENSKPPAVGQVVQYKILHLARLKRVQVEHTVDRQLDWLIIHPAIKSRTPRW